MVVVEHDPDYGALALDGGYRLKIWSCCARFLPALAARILSPGWMCCDLMEEQPELAQINAGVRHKIGTEVDERMKHG